MHLSVGTFNLNNLFSRWNFQGELEAFQDGDLGVEEATEYVFLAPDSYRIRTFEGRLVMPKPRIDLDRIVDSIRLMDVDVLAVQEVEDIDTLKRFAIDELGEMYPYRVLVEGNDPRLIDVGLLSKYPIGAITSHRYAIDPDEPLNLIFGRDLLEVEILNSRRSRCLFTLYNNHLKSNYVRWGDDPVEGARLNGARRRRQAEAVARIVAAQQRPDGRFVIVGDMNDRPDSDCLLPMVAGELGLVDGLADPEEVRRPGSSSGLPDLRRWTYRHKPSGQPAEYHLYDQIWLSPALARRQVGAAILRRRNLTRYGSDHDPAWVVLDV